MRKLVPYSLQFAFAAKTSRNVLSEKQSWFLLERTFGSSWKIGECAPIFGLSNETEVEVVAALDAWVNDATFSSSISSVQAAMEMISMTDTIPSRASIPINGLVWMNDRERMLREARKKIDDGYTTIKLKVGGIRFEDEIYILKALRDEFSPDRLTIRLDANGAFTADNVHKRLEELAVFHIHSIEQPVREGQWSLLKNVCASNIIPVALDEELIGCSLVEALLEETQPHYVVLKPSLHGGFANCDHIIDLAEQRNIGWWATSALESSVGLNAIAQWVYRKNPILPQGLGTGTIYTNNLPSAWSVANGQLVRTGNVSFPSEWLQ